MAQTELSLITSDMWENAYQIACKIKQNDFSRHAVKNYVECSFGRQTLGDSKFQIISQSLVTFLMLYCEMISDIGPVGDYAVYALTELDRIGVIDMILGTSSQPGFLQLIDTAYDVVDSVGYGFSDITIARKLRDYDKHMHYKFCPFIHISEEEFDKMLDDTSFATLFKTSIHMLQEMYHHVYNTYELNETLQPKFFINKKLIENTQIIEKFATILSGIHRLRFERLGRYFTSIWQTMGVAKIIAEQSCDKHKQDSDFVLDSHLLDIVLTTGKSHFGYRTALLDRIFFY